MLRMSAERQQRVTVTVTVSMRVLVISHQRVRTR